MQRIYLSRRNLTALLSKLDRNAMLPGSSQCTIVKQDTVHPKYPCTEAAIIVAVEDVEYYEDREPGAVHPADDPNQKAGETICEHGSNRPLECKLCREKL